MIRARPVAVLVPAVLLLAACAGTPGAAGSTGTPGAIGTTTEGTAAARGPSPSPQVPDLSTRLQQAGIAPDLLLVTEIDGSTLAT